MCKKRGRSAVNDVVKWIMAVITEEICSCLVLLPKKKMFLVKLFVACKNIVHWFIGQSVISMTMSAVYMPLLIILCYFVVNFIFPDQRAPWWYWVLCGIKPGPKFSRKCLFVWWFRSGRNWQWVSQARYFFKIWYNCLMVYPEHFCWCIHTAHTVL